MLQKKIEKVGFEKKKIEQIKLKAAQIVTKKNMAQIENEHNKKPWGSLSSALLSETLFVGKVLSSYFLFVLFFFLIDQRFLKKKKNPNLMSANLYAIGTRSWSWMPIYSFHGFSSRQFKFNFPFWSMTNSGRN